MGVHHLSLPSGFTALILWLALSANPAGAESADFPSIAASSVHIVNQGDRDIHYSIRPQDGEWADYTVPFGESMTIECAGCSTQWFEIVVVTESSEVRYDLEQGKRYSIQWNQAKGLWDVFLAQ